MPTHSQMETHTHTRTLIHKGDTHTSTYGHTDTHKGKKDGEKIGGRRGREDVWRGR